MPMQVSAFSGLAALDQNGQVLQIPKGAPVDVTIAAFTGVYTVPIDCRLVRLAGGGNVLWTGHSNSEAFPSAEYRRVSPGEQFTVS